MKIIAEFTHFPKKEKPIVLTIGYFDGVHRGHQMVLNRLKQVADAQHTEKAVITFQNHPSHLLRPERTVNMISTSLHRIELLKQQDIDYLLLLEFTKEFSLQTAEEFLRRVKQHIPFSHVILGHDAALGRDRQGDPVVMERLSEELDFTVEYLEEWLANGCNVSSSIIRTYIQKGDFEKVKELLGRPYSILGEIIHGHAHGKRLGFPTANLDVSGLCLPPLGVYAVNVVYLGEMHKGVANLGVAPTMRDSNEPVLEVHLFHPKENLYGAEVEVVFAGYIRQEKKFGSPEELRHQIAKDVETAHKILE